MTYDDGDESFGLYDGECQVCGLFGRVDDLSLCEECAGKRELFFKYRSGTAEVTTAYPSTKWQVDLYKKKKKK